MAISAKELPKNHTDNERFAAASSCIATEILPLLFARKRRRSTGPDLYQPPRSRSRRVPDLKVPLFLNDPPSPERRIDFAVFFIVLWSYGRKICLLRAMEIQKIHIFDS